MIEISLPEGFIFNNFEKIIVYINFTEGAYSDYTQFRLLQAAINNHTEAPEWTKNDSLYVDFEYNDIDYFLLMEEYAVGSEDSMFEYFAYMRNDEFVDYSAVDDVYSFTMLDRNQDFDNFTKVDDPKTVLEFLDFDQDASHELVVQKDDIIAGDGVYDSFKYGFINPAGEISFHTLIQEVSSTEIYTDKIGDVKYSGRFQVDHKDIFRDYFVYCSKEVITNITTTSRKDTITTLIQKDLDFDGYVDREVSFEQIYYSTQIVTFTEEITNMEFKPTVWKLGKNSHEGTLTEWRNTTTYVFSSQISFVFRDFEANEVVSTRYYDDLFPNELSEVYNLDNNVITVYNTQNDNDPINDIVVQTPDLENLLSFAHTADGVPAEFERKIIVEEDNFETYNILATEKVISIPGMYNDGSGIADYMEEQEIVADVIEVIPKRGVYYDVYQSYSPDVLEGYKYYYYDEDGDGIHSTIFVVDDNGEVKVIGFDYDFDAYFLPHKAQPVEKHIIKSESTGWKDGDFALKYIGYSNINFEDYDNFDGLFMEPTFSDSLFDVWKMQYTASSSQLIKEVKSLTVHRFLATLSPQKIMIDIKDTLDPIVYALECGAIGGTAFGAAYGPLAPIGFVIGYFIGYFARSSALQKEKQIDMNYYLNAHTLHNEHFEAQTLSEKHWNDEFFGDIMPNTIQGSPRGVYAPVKIETEKHSYEGQVILAPRGIDKTSNWGTQINKITLDYAQQTRNYLSYSDWDDRLNSFFYQVVKDIVCIKCSKPYGTCDHWNFPPTEIKVSKPRDSGSLYMRNTIMFLEEAVHDATTTNNDVHYDRVIPYMMSVDPMFIFADSEGNVPLPEFYEEYPIYVAPDKYDALKDEYHSIYKIYDGESATIQLFPSSSPHKTASEIVMYEAYLVDSLGNEEELGIFVDRHEYNNATGEVTFIPNTIIHFNNLIQGAEEKYEAISDYDAYIVVDFKIEKFRDITDTGDLSTDGVNRIATMQSVQASVLEYIYQFSISQSSQERLNEIAYTAFLTSVTTVVSLVLSYGYSAITSKISSSMMSPWISAEKGYSDIFYRNLAKDLFGLTSAAAKTTTTLGNIFKVGKAVFKAVSAVSSEVVEELLVDPWIEAYVSNKVREAGGDVYEQIWWSTLAESGRESGVSIATTTIRQLVAPSQTQVSGNLHTTSQDTMFDLQMQADFESQQESMTGEIIETALSSILLLLGAVGGGMFGSAGAGLGNIMIGFGTSAEGISAMKDVFKTALLRRQYSKDLYSIPYGEVFHSKVSDPVTQAIYDVIDDNVGDAIRFSTLKSSQKTPPSQKAVEEVKEITSTDTNKLIDWISRHKKGLAVAGYAVAGVVGAIFPVVGAVLSAIPTLTIGLVSSKDLYRKHEKLIMSHKEDQGIITSVCINAIIRLYEALNLEFPTRGRSQFRMISKVYESIMTRSKAHTTQVITYKSVQRMIERAKLAVEQKIIEENSKLLEELVKYSKIPLIFEDTQARYLNTRVDKTNNRLFLYHREALFEELRSLFMYPVSRTSIDKFKMPIEKFMKLISRPVVSLGLLATRQLPKRITSGELMDIDFHIQGISLEDLQSIGYYTTANKLKTIKSRTSEIIKEFMLSNPYTISYVNKEDIEISANEGIDYVGHKYDLIRSIGYALYRIQFDDKFSTTKTPLMDYAAFKYYYLEQSHPITLIKVQKLLEFFSNPEDFNQNDMSIKSLKKIFNKYKDIFTKVVPGVVGTYTHAIEELAVLESFILDKKLDVIHEKEIDEFRHKPDLTVQVDKNFRALFTTTLKSKYQIDLTKIKTFNIDFINAYGRDGRRFVLKKFYKNYQSKEAVSFIILTHHKLYDNNVAKKYIASFDPLLDKMDPALYPEHIRLITIDEFISFFGVKGDPLQNLEILRKLKDQALSHNPAVSDKAFETLIQVYTKAKLTLKLIKTNPTNVVHILMTRQLDITKFLGDPNKKIDDYL